MSDRVHIIMYHYVRELPKTRYPGIKALLLSQFRQQLDFLNAEGYSFVSARQVREAALGGDALPEKSVLLTFDDGYLDHYTNVFPILASLEIPAFFSMPGKILAEKKVLDVNKIHFLLAGTGTSVLIPMLFDRMDHYRGTEFQFPTNTELYEKLAKPTRFDDGDTIFVKRVLQVELPEALRNRITDELFRRCVTENEDAFSEELYMSMDQIRYMASHGTEWGIHGYEHYWMNRLSPEALEQDITKALDVFDGVVPQKDWWCCYPYGSVSDDVVVCARRLGAGAGVTTVVRQAVFAVDDVFHLSRWDTNDFPPKSRRFENMNA